MSSRRFMIRVNRILATFFVSFTRRFMIRGNRILASFFVSFIIATIIPVAALSCVYSVTLRSMEEEVVSRNNSVIDQCRQAADGVFSLTENVVSTLSFDRSARQFTGRYYSYSSPVLAACISELKESVSIQRYVMEQADIVELGVYSSRAQAVVSTRAGYARSDTYFSQSLRVEDEAISGELRSASDFMLHPITRVTLFGQSRDAIIATSPIFSSSGRRMSGASAYAVLDATELSEILGNLLLSEDCFAYIADSEGTILLQAAGGAAGSYSTVDEINVDAGRYIILSSTDSRGYVYTAYVSGDVIYEKVAFIRGMMLIVTLAGLLVGVLASFVLALRTSRPVMDIYNIVKDGSAPSSPAPISYDYLKGTISECIRSNAALSQGMAKYMDYSRRDLIRRLTDGSEFLPNEIDSRARSLGMDLSARTYAALLVSCPAPSGDDRAALDAALSDMNNVWLLVERAFSECGAFSALFSGNYTSEMPILILMDEADEQQCARLMLSEVARISDSLRQRFNIAPKYVCGGFTHDIASVGGLFLRAHDAPASGEGALLFAGEDAGINVYYSLQEEMQLAKAISAGESEIARTLVDRILERNLAADPASPETLRIFRHALYLTLVRAAEAQPASRDEIMRRSAFLLDERTPVSPRALPGAVRDLVESVIALNRFSSENRDKERMREILLYIRERFPDPEFTLYNVSEKFGLPESYLYRYIRAQSGSTFAALLERYRMERAAELLAGSDLSVDDVARETGYNSSHAFRRVFKKCYGMLPTQYRDTMSPGDEA